jgi:anti-sigma regulatory factor (Ser/Thr protein kinase)
MSGSALGQRFHHQAVFYSGLADLVDFVVPFVRDGLDAGEQVLVAQPSDRLDAVRRALGPDAGAVRFLDLAVVGRNPARIIPAWRDFVGEQPPGRPVRGVGEPVWSGRRQEELAECRLHEALLNVAFDDGPAWQLLCPYDVAGLPPDVVEDARRTHPYAGPWPGRTSAAYDGVQEALGEFSRPLPAPPEDATAVPFRVDDLAGLRQLVRRLGEAAGLSEDAADDLVLAAHELATNSILHGGGSGVLHGWQTADALVVQLSDRGVIADPMVGREASASFEESGRGLWIANQLCDLVQVRSCDRGTAVRLHAWR